MSFDIQTLEFHKQLIKLSSFAKTFSVKEDLLNLPIMTQAHDIQYSWQLIDNMIQIQSKYQALPLKEGYDCLHILDLISKEHVMTLEEAYHVFLSLDNQHQMYQFIESIVKAPEHFQLIQDYKMSNIEFLFNKFELVLTDEGDIKSDATPVLERIRKQLKTIDQRYNKSLQAALNQNMPYLNENVVVTRGDALCLAVSESYKNSIKGVIHDISQSKQTIYIEPFASKQIRDEKNILIEEEKREIYKILQTLTYDIFEHIDLLRKQVHTLQVYDATQAKMRFAESMNANLPEISMETIYLKDARHPEIVQGVVPITVHLEKTQKGLFISGPNTGGKTVTLKTIGLIHLMAQAGLFIPASKASKVMVFDHILADIGDQQSIEHNLSTFSSHLKKHQEMLEITNPHTLLLIDEIGSGTDPQEGVAIAEALLETYESKGSMFVVTTHYQALKQYAIKKDYMIASVAFDQASLQPTYHIDYGIAGSSHAFDIATRLNISPEVIHLAKNYYESLQTDAEKLLKRLEIKEKELLKEAKILEETKLEISRIKAQYEKQLQLFEKEKEYNLKKLTQEYETDLKEKQSNIEALLKELKSLKQIPISTYADLKQKQQKLETPIENQTHIDFHIGEEVYIPTYDQYGVIKQIKKDKYFVQVGYFELEFVKSSLQKHISKEKPIKKSSTKKSPKVSHTSKPSGQYVFELDLRGYRYNDVKPALDQAIDQAILTNQASLRIIHGYGTGAVKKAVYDIIKNHPEIKSHRYGQEGEGLTGATIIFFK